MVDSEVLQDDLHRPIVRIGQTVRRPVYPWSGRVHRVLLHLEQVGFPYSPRFLGIDEQGREILTYLEGTCGGDGYLEGVRRGADAWAMVADQEGLRRFARLLRDYHDASTGFEALQNGQVVCHNDFGPWNVVWKDRKPVGIIDWDYAAPGAAVDDVAYALEWSAPFCSDEEAVTWRRLSGPPDRASRIAVFAEAYGLDSPSGLVDAVIARQQATLEQVKQLAADGVQPQVELMATGYGDVLRDRVAWSKANRDLTEPARPRG